MRIDVLVPRLLPRNTLPPRLLPRELVAGGRSLQGSAFQGWSPGTRIDSLIPSRAEYNHCALRMPLRAGWGWHAADGQRRISGLRLSRIASRVTPDNLVLCFAKAAVLWWEQNDAIPAHQPQWLKREFHSREVWTQQCDSSHVAFLLLRENPQFFDGSSRVARV